jgi:hypothetical protein
MKLKINNKNHKIKPASELTISEYIKFFEGFTTKINEYDLLMKYILITTNFKNLDVAKINIDDDTIRRLIAYIGVIPFAHEIEEKKEFYYKRYGKTLYQNTVDWQTLGARGMLENRTFETQTEQAVYLLAIYIAGNYDAKKVEKIYKDLQKYNANEVLGFVVFFFKKLYDGKMKEIGFLRRLLKKVSTSILKLLNK